MTKLLLTTLTKAIITICLVVSCVNTAFATPQRNDVIKIYGTDDYVSIQCEEIEYKGSVDDYGITIVLPKDYVYVEHTLSATYNTLDYIALTVKNVRNPRITYVVNLSYNNHFGVHDLSHIHMRIVEQ